MTYRKDELINFVDLSSDPLKIETADSGFMLAMGRGDLVLDINVSPPSSDPIYVTHVSWGALYILNISDRLFSITKATRINHDLYSCQTWEGIN